jgi:class 3 adenylate cyclase
MSANNQINTQDAAIVFTDIVGSCATKKAIGGDAAYFVRVLSPHHASVRRLMPQFRGTEIKTTGDGFLMVFDEVRNAILFSMQLQDYFASEAFSADLSIQVRIGIHFGTIIAYQDGNLDVAGAAVDFASRICAVANGSQVVVSQEVASRLDERDFRLVEWPGYVLKGFDGVHSIFQVVWGTHKPEQPDGAGHRVCSSLLSLIRPAAWRPGPSAPFVRLRLKSIKYGKTWEYDVRSTVACGALATALAEQHFSPFHTSFDWFLYTEDGERLADDKTVSEAGAKDGSVVCLRMTYVAPQLDPFRLKDPNPQFYADNELNCSANFAHAIESMERIVRDSPTNTHARNNLASAYLEANRNIPRASQLLDESFQLQPSLRADACVQDTLGWLAYRRGEYHEAETHLRQSLAGTPRDADRDGYNTTLYHLYFTWRRTNRTLLATLAKEELASWIGKYGQTMLFAKRVRIDDDSYVLPDVRYLSPAWLRHLDVESPGGGPGGFSWTIEATA